MLIIRQGINTILLTILSAFCFFSPTQAQLKLSNQSNPTLSSVQVGSKFESHPGLSSQFFIGKVQKDKLSNFHQAFRNGQLRFEKLQQGIYLIEALKVLKASQLTSWGIESVGVLQPFEKLQQSLNFEQPPPYAITKNGKWRILVNLHPGVPLNTAKKIFEDLGITSISSKREAYGIFEFEVTRTEMIQLAELAIVNAIFTAKPPDSTLNRIGRAVHGAPLLNAPLAQGGFGLLGQGITVGVGDDSDPTLHPDISDRVIDFSPGLTNNHGAHVAGIIAGAGNIQPLYRGMAPSANIVSDWFSSVWQNAEQYHLTYNMVLTNNSYGSVIGDCILSGTYDLDSRVLDQQAWELPTVLHVFASGNDGQITCSPFPTSYNTILSGYQSAKNIITVGRVNEFSAIGASSSSGPTKDGRVKPEIVADGSSISSLYGNFSMSTPYWTTTGTSQAAPMVTGGLALLYQRYRQLNGNADPRGDLMKTILLNGAYQQTVVGPTFRMGFGVLNLPSSIRILNNKWYWQKIAENPGIQYDTVIQVPAGASKLKVMLYWHDQPNNVLAAKTLVNDLDLLVITPNGETRRPLVLNATPQAVTQPAVPGEDHTNNVEQIVELLPAAGPYTLRVSASDLTIPNQPFAVAFDLVPPGLRFANPTKESSWAQGETIPISWDFEGNNGDGFTLEYSTNNGASWTFITNSINGTHRLYGWIPDGTISPSTQTRLRISRNNSTESAISEPFTLLGRPTLTLAPANEQCPGYIKIKWTSVPGADGYEIMMKRGPEMQPIAVVNAQTNTYTLVGLETKTVYYLAVRAVLQGKPGLWLSAIERMPNEGDCQGTIGNNDLMVDSLLSPQTGRMFTSSAIKSNALTVNIRNLATQSITKFRIQHSINNSPLQSEIISQPIGSVSTYTHTIHGYDFSAVGDYQILVIVENLDAPDPNPKNDTLRTTVRNLSNPPISLATQFLDGFEDMDSIELTENSMGFAGSQRWDYVRNQNIERLRTQALSNVAHLGSKAITLDVQRANLRLNNQGNNLIGTFNLNTEAVGNDARLSFHFMHHGPSQIPSAQNKVWVRGADTDNWIEVYDLGANQPFKAGEYKKSASIEIADSLSKYGQSFTSSTQFRFGQQGTHSMATLTKYAGYSFDDLTLYRAQNDLQLLKINSPFLNNCGLSNKTVISVELRNSMAAPISDAQISYQIDNGTVITETLPTIAGNTTITYNFKAEADFSAISIYLVKIKAQAPGDNVQENNELTMEVINKHSISDFPYIEDFESGQNHWYATGKNSSWQFGTPEAKKIKSAASGVNAWKTNRIGSYNSLEQSHLYSPCFEIGSLKKPTLSFALAYDIEDCRVANTVCDLFYVEYSNDGLNWRRLGAQGNGFNWYDNGPNPSFMSSNQTWWHVATTPLPKTGSTIMFRFVMQSDEGVEREGVAVDDIHVYDLEYPIYTTAFPSAPKSLTTSSNTWVPFVLNNQLIANLNATTNNLGNTRITAFKQDTVLYDGRQYFGPRNITIAPTRTNLGPAPSLVQFYFTDQEVNLMRAAKSCTTCLAPLDFSELNITKYTDVQKSNEDGSLTNNRTGYYGTIENKDIQFVPYDSGYYAQFPVNGFSEFWLTDGHLVLPLPTQWIAYSAVLQNNQLVVNWQVDHERLVNNYQVEISTDGGNHFTAFSTTPPLNNGSIANYQEAITMPSMQASVILVRIKRLDTTGQIFYTELMAVQTGNDLWQVYINPNPVISKLKATITSSISQILQWKMIDAAGRLVQRGSLAPTAGISTLTSQPIATNGSYVLITEDEIGHRQIHRFVVLNHE